MDTVDPGSLSDWDKLNNKVARLTEQVGDLKDIDIVVDSHAGILNKLQETVASQTRSIERLHDTVQTQNRIVTGLQKRVTSLEAKYATNYIDVKDTSPIDVKDTSPSSSISVSIPPVPHKDNTSKLLLKRFLAVQRICEASIDLDRHRAVAPSTDRQWLAQSVLNILNGNVDD